MTTTANLLVAKIDTAQAQKEVTANMAFDVFDAALTQLSLSLPDANYTLSTATAPQEWQYGILVCTGTLSAARNVIVPLNLKKYVLVNNTSGGFPLTLKTSAGTGIAVSAGSTAILRCDGTNVVSVVGGTATQPFDVTAFCPGLPGPSAKLLRIPFARSVSFPANLAGSYALASLAATASAAFNLTKNGSTVGTITFAAGASTATFTTVGGAAFSVVAGDRIDIIAPATPDATLTDVGFVLAGTR